MEDASNSSTAAEAHNGSELQLASMPEAIEVEAVISPRTEDGIEVDEPKKKADFTPSHGLTTAGALPVPACSAVTQATPVRSSSCRLHTAEPQQHFSWPCVLPAAVTMDKALHVVLSRAQSHFE